MGDNKKQIKNLVIKYYLNDYDKNADQTLEQDIIKLLLNDDYESKEIVDDALYDLWLDENKEFDASDREKQFERLVEEIVSSKGEMVVGSLGGERVGLRRITRVLLRVAAVVIPLLMIVSVGLYYFNSQPQESFMVEWQVGNGQTESHNLADQSEVWINSGSRLSVVQNENIRSVELTGESYFNVTKDKKERVFEVKTPNLLVVVKGTKFNVEAYDDQLFERVTLDEGAVSVFSKEGEEWNLQPGEQLLYDKSTDSVSIVNIVEEGDRGDRWLDGALLFRNMSMGEMLSMIERKYDVQIVVDDSIILPDLLYTVEFKSHSTVQEVLKVLCELTDTDYSINLEEGRVVEIKLK